MATCELLYSNVVPRTVQYQKAVISYIDILGFRDLIDSRSAGEISKVLRILAESVEPHPLLKSERTKFTKFSDTVNSKTAPKSSEGNYRLGRPHLFRAEWRWRSGG